MTAAQLPFAEPSRQMLTPVLCRMPACPARPAGVAGELWFAGGEARGYPWAAAAAHNPAHRGYTVGVYQAILWVLTMHATTHPGPAALPGEIALEARQQADEARGLTRRSWPWPVVAECLYCGAPIAYTGAEWIDRHEGIACPAADAIDYDARFGLIEGHHHPSSTPSGGATR